MQEKILLNLSVLLVKVFSSFSNQICSIVFK